MKPRRDGEPLRIVCTDDGQHATVQLAEYRNMVNGRHGLTAQLPPPGKPPTLVSPGDWDLYEPGEVADRISTESYVFRCPRCRRNMRRDADRFDEQLALLYDGAQLDRLDISRC